MSQRLSLLEKMLEEDQTDSFIKYAIAKELEKLDRLDEAIIQFEKLEQEDPDYVGLYYHLGHLYVETDAVEKAISTYKKGISVAKAQNDLHALSELMNAKTNAEIL